MKITLYTILFMLLMVPKTWSQTLDELKITNEELPKNYTFTTTPSCISIQACSLYNQIGMYSAFVGKIKNKEVQNFKSKNDIGSILYFEFENDCKGEGFLSGLLWGSEKKPTIEHPEKYFIKGNILIIWSFNNGSEIEKISEDKIHLLLK